jgi:hypothetical protein
MYHVLDHSDVVYTGDLSASTQYIIDHYGKRLDEAVQTGIRLLYTDMLHTLNHAKDVVLGDPDHWRRIEDWKVD